MKLRLWSTLAELNAALGTSSVLDGAGNAVLMYHSVGNSFGYPDGSVYSAERFRDDLRYLSENYELVDLPRVLEADTSDKRVALTFDDGFRDFYSTALPILQEFDAACTVFLVSDIVLGNLEPTTVFDLDFAEAAKVETMNETDVSALVDDDLVTIGNHTRTHPNLQKLDDDGELVDEIVGGKRSLEERFDIEVNRFCYPGGRFDDRSVRCVREAHEIAVTVDRGLLRDSTVDPMLVPRIDGSQARSVVEWELSDLGDGVRQFYNAVTG
jgi:peptidoglycan/xylan/chitin deacetylase (PgdA/CDA1 family)